MRGARWLALLLLFLGVHFSFGGDFGCACGHVDTTFDQSKECMAKLKEKKAAAPSGGAGAGNGTQGRIVGGYDVEKDCMKRPFLVLIRIRERQGKEVGNCMGSIINKKFVVTAAHCFCGSNGRFGICAPNNGKELPEKMPSGHPKYEPGTKNSTADPETIPKTTVLVPGSTDTYDMARVTEQEEMAGSIAVKKVKNIIIHPDYISGKRDQNDVALVEIVDEFDFSKPANVGPICLPPEGFVDHNLTVYMTGYGKLYETDSETKQASCNTGSGGPSEYTPCRKFWLVAGARGQKCDTNSPSPAAGEAACEELKKAKPDCLTSQCVLEVEKKNVTCYPSSVDGSTGWCAVCLKDAKVNEPGYCDPEEKEIPLDYPDTRNDVSASLGWGYCDKKCYSQFVDAGKLQEAELWALSEQDCDNRTKKFLTPGMETSLKMRPQPDKEICVAKVKNKKVTYFTKEGSNFKQTAVTDDQVWGGSDSCQGDSGGGLWTVDKNTTVLVGITNRGQGCARSDSYGIYSRVSFYKSWILSLADSGKCA